MLLLRAGHSARFRVEDLAAALPMRKRRTANPAVADHRSIFQLRRPHSPISLQSCSNATSGYTPDVNSQAESYAKAEQAQPEVQVRIVPAGTQPTMRAKIVEVDASGSPVILRQQDPAAPGGVRTIITQEDGTCRAFGEAIVESLLLQEETKVMSWVSSMDARNLRGLVNELSERFYETQRHLCKCKAELEEMRRNRGLSLFNLPRDCTEKDLEVAYRRLARSMHPDKNGGTEEAKEKFQTMRASYEELKEQIDSEKDNFKDSESADRTEDEASGANEVLKTDADIGSVTVKEEEVFYCRSQNLSALQGAVCKILRKMQVLQQNVSMVERDLCAHGI